MGLLVFVLGFAIPSRPWHGFGLACILGLRLNILFIGLWKSAFKAPKTCYGIDTYMYYLNTYTIDLMQYMN